MDFIYIHGFNSGVNSRSCKELSRILTKEVYCVCYDYASPFIECLQNISCQINARGNDEYCIMGSSLGGFYALQLRLCGIKKVIAWNPVTYPAVQLVQFLGKNTRFSDGQDWIFTKDLLYSYAQAPDPRMWKNSFWLSLPYYGREGIEPTRIILLGKRDDLLDPYLSYYFWKGQGKIKFIEESHSIENYEHIKDLV